MAAKPGQSSNKTIKCPSCGSENILGVDRCETCFHSLMQRGLPKPKKDDNFQSVMMTAPIAELMTGRDLLVGSTTDTVQKVVKILQKEKKSCVLIYEKKKLVGIISLRDLLKKVVGKHKDLSKVKVGAAMTPNPEFVRSEDPIAYAVNKMAMGGFRHLPVLDANGAPLSIISIQNVMEYLSRHDNRQPAV